MNPKTEINLLPRFDSREWLEVVYPGIRHSPEWFLAVEAASAITMACWAGEIPDPHVERKAGLVGIHVVAHMIYPFIKAAQTTITPTNP